MVVGFAQADTTVHAGRAFSLSVGLGVDILHAADIVDYSNSISTSGMRSDDFGIAAEFFGSSEIRVSESWGIKLEYSYLVNSNDVSARQGYAHVVNYDIHMPTVLAQYLFLEKGFALKFGGGMGYHVAEISIPDVIVVSQGKDYTSKGIGIKMEAEGNTEFDEHFFGVITADIRKDFMNEITDLSGKALVIQNTGKHASMNFFSIGLKFGFIYYF
jgi:hypothetical protein